MISNMYVGFATAPRDDWKAIALDPKPHGGIKDPVKQAAYLQEKLQSLKTEKAYSSVCLARLSAIVVLDTNGAELLSAEDEPSRGFMELVDGAALADDEWLLAQKPQLFLRGLNVSTAVRLAFMEACVAGMTIAGVNLRRLLDSCLDPYRFLVPEADRSAVDFSGLCRYAGHVSVDERDESPLSCARRLAEAARRLSDVFSL